MFLQMYDESHAQSGEISSIKITLIRYRFWLQLIAIHLFSGEQSKPNYVWENRMFEEVCDVICKTKGENC